jgi:hypothetical protein
LTMPEPFLYIAFPCLLQQSAAGTFCEGVSA